nr:uncharacterized protein LOC113704781 [Coffea arabica]
MGDTVLRLNIDQSRVMDHGTKQTKKKGVRVPGPSDRQLQSAPKLDVSRIDLIKVRLPFDSVVVNLSADIWVFFSTPLVCVVVGSSAQHVTISVQHPWMDGSLCFSFVHAKCSLGERRVLWQDLKADKPSSRPWCVCGDFNVIADPSEKRGGRPFAGSEGLELLSFMEGAELFDAGFSGSSFTWCNNRRGHTRIWKRLDRVLINGEFSESAPSISVVHLARHPSDHAPLKISLTSRMDNRPRAFRFLNVWTSNPGLLDVIRQAWQAETSGSPLKILCSKLLRARRAIQGWNKGGFGNVFEVVKRAEANVLVAEARTEQDDSMEAQQRRVQGAIHRVKDENGIWVEDDEGIANEAVRFFSNLFSASGGSAGDWEHLIPHMVSQADRAVLDADPTREEVKRVVFEMDGDSAAGPDGFTGQFFTFAWDVIAQDVYNAVLSFFCGAELPRFVTFTSIVLIPKVPSPQDFSKYRPISSCNFFNKMLSRILADRLASILPKIVSPQQTGFVKGRNITENYLLAQELMSGIRKKARGGNVALKLDMAKAYDRVSWIFIVRVLRKFGFGERLIDMVWRLVSNVWFSVIINGASHGFFKSSRGIRQGDPLSPALFVIGAEVLSRGLNSLAAQSGFLGFTVPRGCPSVTHLAFADDVLIFANGSSSSLKEIMRVLDMYQLASEQLVSAQKSGYLVHPSVPPARRRVVERITGFSRQHFPVRYLGFPLYIGRCKSLYFGEVCHAISARILSWRSKLLSPGGRLVLIKHVLSSLPTHLLSAAVIPVATFKSIERLCANFLWGSSTEQTRHHWIRWSHLCYPVMEGGAGFRRVSDVYNAFSCKLWWGLHTGSSLWTTFMRAKYCNGVHPCQVVSSRAASPTWRRMINVSRQAELCMVWLLNDGTCDFWYDNWLGSGPLFLRALVVLGLSFSDVLVNGTWDNCRLSQILPPSIANEVMQTPTLSGRGTDQVIWRSTQSGLFTLAAAFQEVCQGRNRSLVFSRIWHPRIPLRVSLFMLRLLMRRLPLDDVLREMGFQLASKCCCCALATGETLEHVFSAGQIPMEVWAYFQNICGIGRSYDSLRAHLFEWWMLPTPRAKQRFVFDIVPVFICWNIWKARCRAVFERARVRVKELCEAVFQDVKLAFEVQFSLAVHVSDFSLFYERVAQSTVRYEFRVVRWRAGGQADMVLNTDGCSKGNPGASGGGGLLRDSAGQLLVAFSAYLGEATSLHAEVLAMFKGVQRRCLCPWSVRREVEQIWHLVEGVQFEHCYREANKIADILSNVGVSHPQEQLRVYSAEQTLPSVAQGECRLNRLGVPSVRRVRIGRAVGTYECSWILNYKTLVENYTEPMPPMLPCTFELTKFSDVHKYADLDHLYIKGFVIQALPVKQADPDCSSRDITIVNEDSVIHYKVFVWHSNKSSTTRRPLFQAMGFGIDTELNDSLKKYTVVYFLKTYESPFQGQLQRKNTVINTYTAAELSHNPLPLALPENIEVSSALGTSSAVHAEKSSKDQIVTSTTKLVLEEIAAASS